MEDLPKDLSVKRLLLDSASGPLEWWRVTNAAGRLLGSGFDRRSAIFDALRTLERREPAGVTGYATGYATGYG